jgi:2-amino-4-hydroxy-6-hydroxymethyldihydropteridine diphosphokinase
MLVVRRQAAIALGSNVGDRQAHLTYAMERLRVSAEVRVLAVSTWLETAPVGGPLGQGAYLNGACLVDTTLEPHALLDLLLTIEQERGRDRAREERHGPRTLDLDLILCGDLQHDDERLSLPHPRWTERLFVLEPLAQIAPDLVDTRSGRTVAQLAAHVRAQEQLP